MDISDLEDFPIRRIKVRGLVCCGDEYIFIQRCHHGKTKKFLVFPGGRIKKSDRVKGNKKNLGTTLKAALVRELHEELAAREIVIGEFLGVSKLRQHDREVLFRVDVASVHWEQRSGKEFDNPNKGTYEIVKVKELTKEILGRKGFHLKPKEWRKLLYRLETK